MLEILQRVEAGEQPEGLNNGDLEEGEELDSDDDDEEEDLSVRMRGKFFFYLGRLAPVETCNAMILISFVQALTWMTRNQFGTT